MYKLLLALSLMLSTPFIDARKSALAGYGQISKVTGLPKTNIVNGYSKVTSSGTIFVQPYARSK